MSKIPKKFDTGVQHPVKKAPAKTRLVFGSDSESSDEFPSVTGAQERKQEGEGTEEEREFKINTEYAKRFEYNKKREELQKLEEKYGSNALKKSSHSDSPDSGDSSDSEDEDETAVLATVQLDQEIAATLAAIRKKDPRVYDGKTTFYTPIEPVAEGVPSKPAEEKPVFLRDYHLSNLLSGTGAESDTKTFVQEQEDLKRTVVKEIHQAATKEGEADHEDDEDDETFLVRKPNPEPVSHTEDPPSPSLADKDPEEFLSKFLTSRVWAKSTAYPALESDDSEHEETAEAFEKAYNFRFENPSVDARSVLTSYGRDAISANTVRREDKSSRKKTREAKREKRQREKEEREREKGRLRKLKTEELMERFKMVREAAGMEEGDEEIEAEVLEKLLEGEFSDEQWAEWMAARFGDEYYKQGGGKIKKPEFEDDIDIDDIVPDFEEDAPPTPGDSNDTDEGGVPIPQDEQDEDASKPTQPTDKKSLHKAERKKKQKDKELRRKLEAYVEDNFDFSEKIPTTAGFRYRQTTPESYGLTPLDILTATDQDLNSYAGLKKLASFREPEKKKKDKKRYGKKKRLREWRKDVFGDEEGVVMPPGWKPEGLKKTAEGKGMAEGGVGVRVGDGERDGEREKKRRKKNKS